MHCIGVLLSLIKDHNFDMDIDSTLKMFCVVKSYTVTAHSYRICSRITLLFQEPLEAALDYIFRVLFQTNSHAEVST